MNIFVSTTVIEDQRSVLEAVEIFRKHNIFNIELGSTHLPEKNLEIKLKKTKCNYIMHNFFPPTFERFVLNIASADKHIRESSLKFIMNSIDFAERIGAKIYTIHPGFLTDPSEESHPGRNYDFDFSFFGTGKLVDRHIERFDIFFESLRKISDYISRKPIMIAVETQGSCLKKDFMLFSKPEEISKFVKKNKDEKIGINLNLGHLNLAANAWGFDKYELVEAMKPKLMAVEVSHNEGIQDEHATLKPDSWYAGLLKDSFFKKIPVIFEGRNLPICDVVTSYMLLRNLLK